MVKDAESHAAEDEAKRELIDLRNQADQLVYQTEQALKEHGDKIEADTRGPIEQAINRLKDAQKSDDKATIQSAIDELNKVSHKLAEEMYKSASPPPGMDPAAAAAAAGAAGAANAGVSASDSGSAKTDDDVIDAEFEVKE